MSPASEPTEDLIKQRDSARIGAMFDGIAGRYDLINRLMTMGQDGRWRRLAIDAARLQLGDHVLDVATGTGDLALEIAKRVGAPGRVVGIDIAAGMLDIAREKSRGKPITYELDDVLTMVFVEEFDAVTVGFGLRNFSDRFWGIQQMVRAMKPGGRLVILELVRASGPLRPAINLYELRIIPQLGRLISRDAAAYEYLPKSVAGSPSRLEIEQLMRDAGLVRVGSRGLNLGTVAICWGQKP